MARRSNINLNSGQSRRGTVKNSVRRNSIPRIQSGAAGTDLSAAFGSFFNQSISALSTLGEADRLRQEQEIRDENDREAKQAVGDVETGVFDESLANDKDYMDARAKQIGMNLGSTLGDRLTDFVSNLDPKADARKMSESFMQQVLKDARPENDIAAAYAATTLRRITDALIQKHNDNKQTVLRNEGINGVKVSVEQYQRSGQSLTTGVLDTFTQDMQKVNPVDARTARTQVVKTLVSNADTPEQISEVQRLLGTPGSGVNGKSFFNSFAGTREELETQLNTRKGSLNSAQAYDKYQTVSTAIEKMTLDNHQDVRRLLDNTHRTEGADRAYDAANKVYKSKLKAIMKEAAKVRAYWGRQGTEKDKKKGQYKAWTAGKETVTQDHRGLRDTVTFYPTPFTNDEAVRNATATLAQQDGGHGTEIQDQLENALAGGDPVAAQQAFSYIHTLKLRLGSAAELGDYLPEDTMALYERVERSRRHGGGDVAKVLAEERAALQDPTVENALKTKGGLQFYVKGADGPDDARKKLTAEIKSAAEVHDPSFSPEVTIPGNVMLDLERVITEDLKRNNNRLPWKTVVESRVAASMSRFYSIPRPDGDVTIALKDDSVPGLPLNVSTNERYHDNIGKIAGRLPSLVPDADKVSVRPAGPRGYVLIDERGNDITFRPGDEIKVRSDDISDEDRRKLQDRVRDLDNPISEEERKSIFAQLSGGRGVKKMTIPTDLKEAAEFLESVDLGDDWQLIRVDHINNGKPEPYYQIAMVMNRKAPENSIDDKEAAKEDQNFEDFMVRLRTELGLEEDEPEADPFDIEVGAHSDNVPQGLSTSDGVSSLVDRFGTTMGKVAQGGQNFLDMLGEMFREDVAKAGAQGTVEAAHGTTKPLGEMPKTLDEFLERLRALEIENETKHGPEAREGYAETGEFAERMRSFMGRVEGTRYKSYDDGVGKTTVGVGFNMDAPGAKERFKEALPTVDFAEVYTGKTELLPSQVDALLKISLQDAKDHVKSKFKGVHLKEHEYMALVSLAFNNPSLIGPKLIAAIKSGNKEAAIREILFHSNANRNDPDVGRGIDNRRIDEAHMFAGHGYERWNSFLNEFNKYRKAQASKRGKRNKST